jgi:hemerythrin superfamily protein
MFDLWHAPCEVVSRTANGGRATEYSRVSGGASVNAVQMLKADHQKVKELFEQFEQAGDRAYAKKREIAEQVFEELEIHTKLEEEIFYPAMQERGGKEGEELIAESIQEHHVVDVLMAEMHKLDAKDDEWEAKFTVLQENVEHHVEEEEGEMFPMAQEKLGEILDRLGAKMQERKQALQTAGRSGRR